MKQEVALTLLHTVNTESWSEYFYIQLQTVTRHGTGSCSSITSKLGQSFFLVDLDQSPAETCELGGTVIAPAGNRMLWQSFFDLQEIFMVRSSLDLIHPKV